MALCKQQGKIQKSKMHAIEFNAKQKLQLSLNVELNEMKIRLQTSWKLSRRLRTTAATKAIMRWFNFTLAAICNPRQPGTKQLGSTQFSLATTGYQGLLTGF